MGGGKERDYNDKNIFHLQPLEHPIQDYTRLSDAHKEFRHREYILWLSTNNNNTSNKLAEIYSSSLETTL